MATHTKDPLADEVKLAKRALGAAEQNRDALQKVFDEHSANMARLPEWTAQQVIATRAPVDVSLHDAMLTSMLAVDAALNEQLAAANQAVGQARLWLMHATARARK